MVPLLLSVEALLHFLRMSACLKNVLFCVSIIFAFGVFFVVLGHMALKSYYSFTKVFLTEQTFRA